MNWISNVVRPKIRNMLVRRETPENLWIKCPETGQLVFYKDVEANLFVIPGSNYHMRMAALARLKSVFDNETWFDIAVPEVPVDPLKFRDERRYADRIKDARAKTGLNDAIKLGFGRLERQPVVIGVQDFDFMGGSLGMAAGEAVIKGIETAVSKGTPFIMFAASVHRGADQSDHRWRHRVLRNAGRRPHRRAGRVDRFCGTTCDRADDPRKAAGRISKGRIPQGTRHGGHGGASP
jgi:acetyl-CoA carboxylase beta subunit